MSTRTTETQRPAFAVSAAMGVPASVPNEVGAPNDLTQSAEVRACIEQLTRLQSTANEAARAADDHAAENPEAAIDAQRARDAADMAANGRNEVIAAARTGNRAALDRAIQRSANVYTAVTNAADIVEEHGHATSGDSSRRIAHEVTLQAKAGIKTAGKVVGAAAAQFNARTRDALRGVSVHARGDDDDDHDDAPASATARGATGGGLFGIATPREGNGGSNLGTTLRTVRRESRRLGSAVRRGTYGAAESLGVLDSQGARTARGLEDQMAHARTEQEYNTARGERNDAIERRLLGVTFLDQEIRDALPTLERTTVGRELINQDNTFSSSLYTSSVLNRLRANGYINGDRGWNPMGHAHNSQWSHSVVQRIDRNGDGQLSAQEIHYAMTHRYQASAPAARPASSAGAQAMNPVSIALGASRDAALAATPFGRQINELLGNFQNHAGLRQRFDTDRDGRVELHEVIDKLAGWGIRGMSDVDTNRDGDITMQELAAAMRTAAQRMQQRRT